MSGIYIHVPFCNKKCSYCDFYSVGLGKLTEDFPKLITREIELRAGYLPNKSVDTIYFGGGTPSLLPVQFVEEILNAIHANFVVRSTPEITIEVNPDDVTESLLNRYVHSGINRISIGVQSFIDEELRVLGRRHDSEKAIDSIKKIYKSGISNVSLDLIYGLPNSSLESWEYSLCKAFEQGVQHLSCYHLTYEESTPLTRMLRKNVINPIDEDVSIKQYELLRKLAKEQGFTHYEISNFAKEGYISRHNSSYWLNIPYLGLGPSAHSFNISTRQWNPSSIGEWGSAIKDKNPNLQTETIDETTRFNELMLTRLRTIWGVDLKIVANEFEKKYSDHLRRETDAYLKQGCLIIENNTLKIPFEKWFISDTILSNLVFV